jgi:hypothetical protein
MRFGIVVNWGLFAKIVKYEGVFCQALYGLHAKLALMCRNKSYLGSVCLDEQVRYCKSFLGATFYLCQR